MSIPCMILATRFDRAEDDFIVLARITSQWTLDMKLVSPEKWAAEHRKQTNLDGKPVYRHVWLQDVNIPEETA